MSDEQDPGRDEAPNLDERTLPKFTRRYQRSETGLFVPRGVELRRPVPLDQIRAYLTAEELMGTRPSWAQVAHILSSTSFESTLAFASNLLRLGDLPGKSFRDVDEFFIVNYMTPAMQATTRRLLNDQTRVLVSPQLIFSLLKLSAAKSPTALMPSEEDGNLPFALVALSSFIDPAPAASTSQDELAARMHQLTVAAGHFFTDVNVPHLVARFMKQWFDPPTDATHDSRYSDLKTLFKEHVGVEIEDLVTFAIVIHSVCIESGPTFDHASLAAFQWTDDRLNQVLSLICSSRKEIQETVRDLPEESIAWDINLFERFPVVQTSETQYVVVQPDLLLRRVFSFLPVWELRHAVGEDSELRGKIDNAVTLVGEACARETLFYICKKDSGELYNEAQLKAAYVTGKKQKVCDAAIRHGSAWVMLEITSSQLRRESVAGLSGSYIDSDLHKLVIKARQLDQTISRLRADPSKLTEDPEARAEVFYPVLVLTEGFPVNPISLTALREHVAGEGLLIQPGVMPLEVADSVDLEMLEGLDETTTLSRILADKQASSMRLAGIRDYLILHRKANARSPERVMQSWEAAVNLARNSLLQGLDDDAANNESL